MKTFARRAIMGLALALTIFAGNSANAQKIAVLDSRQILAELPEAQAASQRLQAIQKSWTDSLETMKVQYQTKIETYQKVGDTGSPDYKKKAADDLKSMEDSFNKFRDSKFGPDGEYTQRQATMLKPIYDKIHTALDAFRKKEKFSIVLDKNNALASDDAIDITAKFFEYLKAQK